MIYRFRSEATGELIMLETTARRILQILEREVMSPGILQVIDMPAAMAAIHASIAAEEAQQKAAQQEAKSSGQPQPQMNEPGLRQRCHTFLQMLERCIREETPVLW